MVVLRRRQVATLRLIVFGCLMLGTLYTVYHYVDGGPDYTAEMERMVHEFNNETGLRNFIF